MAGDNTALRSLLLGPPGRTPARDSSRPRWTPPIDCCGRRPAMSMPISSLVELYVARDWNSLAAEKLVLLGRLAELNNDEETRQRLCAVASRAFPTDERLEALCS